MARKRLWLRRVALAALLFVPVVWLGLPPLLRAAGLHAHVELPPVEAPERRALIVTTSHDTLGATGKATGVWASEMTVPYYAFRAAGMQVDVASIRGGEIPVEPQSVRWPVATADDRRFLVDEEFQRKVENSLRIDEIVASRYDVLFLAGGWGAAYDLAQSEALGQKVTEAYAAGAVVGGVCHGPLGLLQAKAPDGRPLVEGRRISAVTDKQIRELGITLTPKHPERDLRAAGAVFEAESRFRDIFASHVVVDGRLVTGQNQNSGSETAYEMVVLAKQPRTPLRDMSEDVEFSRESDDETTSGG